MGIFAPSVKKVSAEAVAFESYRTLTAYEVRSGCQFLGWVARCEYEGGGTEWMARTRDGAESTRMLTTKTEAVDLLNRAYDIFQAFDAHKTPYYDVNSKKNDRP